MGQEGTRYGLNELYIPVNPDMVPAQAEGMKKVLVPYGNWDDDILWYFQDLAQRSPQVKVIDKSNTWAGDASDALYIYVPLPSRESLLSQAEGMNAEMLQKWGVYLRSKDPEYAAFNGFIPSSDGSRFYVRALDAFQNGGLYYYHLLLNPGPQSANWSVAAETTPRYDEASPSGKGFYRGKDWSDQLEKSPDAVPGFIAAIDWWANLILSGPTEITGNPGEEKEVTFTLKNESPVKPSVRVGVKREGDQKYSTVVEGVTAPEWGNGSFTLNFRVESQPYKVRVAVLDPRILEAKYTDNYVEITVKPVLPPPPVNPGDQGGTTTGGGEDGSGSTTGELVFYARSQGGQDIYGNYKPPEDRPVNTAKYADIVKAVLRPKPPTPPRGRLVSWEITSATLAYPKRHPDFWFGHPVEPVGTVTVSMVPNGHEATVEFEQDWSLAGAPIYDMATDQMAPPPTYYTITASYTIRYVYEYTECDEDGCWTVRKEATASGTASGKLLVNSTGINIL
ncbi:MAG: hypothetical protein L5656_10615 [Thermanaeromonas sp.]|uniref:hypothetical protein n=1 Tax=Thermanaeromonas sp. TaxID=2003697 RepID=UPI002440958F|nr:hypothetical protein [Thermanaeromonas sp.]MCG0278954.1 hypothetical protein [Thermanaeromonas sp.]